MKKIMVLALIGLSNFVVAQTDKAAADRMFCLKKLNLENAKDKEERLMQRAAFFDCDIERRRKAGQTEDEIKRNITRLENNFSCRELGWGYEKLSDKKERDRLYHTVTDCMRTIMEVGPLEEFLQLKADESWECLSPSLDKKIAGKFTDRQVDEAKELCRREVNAKYKKAEEGVAAAEQADKAKRAGTQGRKLHLEEVILPNHSGCISLENVRQDKVLKDLTWFDLKNTCSMPLSVHWCDTLGCTRADFSATISPGDSTTDQSYKLKIEVLDACQLDSRGEYVFYNSDTRQCSTLVLMN